MKLLLRMLCVVMMVLGTMQLSAQETIKTKDDKAKMKDKAKDVKVKDKGDKYKVKDADGKMKVTADETKMKGDSMASANIPANNAASTSMNYTPRYSNFALGNAAYSKIVIDLWKDWDDNQFDRHDYFADTIAMMHENGTLTTGKAENMKMANDYRGSMKSAKSTITAIVPLKSLDFNEEWVAIWGHEDDVMTDGKAQGREIHEIWRFNKDGKIDYMQSYSGGPGMQQ